LESRNFQRKNGQSAIIVAWADKRRRFTWITRDECRVPEKYLKIFESLNGNLKLALIHEFIAHNRQRV
jgi:hypothetical protein